MSGIPTMEDLIELAIHEPIITKVLQLQHYEGLSERDALIMMVMRMTECKNVYQKKVVEYAQNSQHPLRIK